MKGKCFLPLTTVSHLNLIYSIKFTEYFILNTKLYVKFMSKTSGIVAVKLLGEVDPIYHLNSFRHPILLPLHLPQ